MDDNQFRIMSIDDHAEVEQLRIIVREQQVKLKGLAENSLNLEKRLKEVEGEKIKI